MQDVMVAVERAPEIEAEKRPAMVASAAPRIEPNDLYAGRSVLVVGGRKVGVRAAKMIARVMSEVLATKPEGMYFGWHARGAEHYALHFARDLRAKARAERPVLVVLVPQGQEVPREVRALADRIEVVEEVHALADERAMVGRWCEVAAARATRVVVFSNGKDGRHAQVGRLARSYGHVVREVHLPL